LPAGVSLDAATGSIVGAAVAIGDFPFTIQATDATGATAAQPLALHVERAIPPVAIVTAGLPGAESSVAYSQPLEAAGGLGTYTWAITGGALPAGLSLTADGRISGTSVEVGMATVVITASDAADGSRAASRTFTLTVAPPRDVVLYAADATLMAGNYQLVADATAAGGLRLSDPDQGAAKRSFADAVPGSYVEFTFHAEGGRPYWFWLRGRADRNSWRNDSVFIQFDQVAAARIGTTSALTLTLEEDINAGLAGWGWQDHGFGTGVIGAPVTFERSGWQTLRIQPREDGLSFDQIVLSPDRFQTLSPGAAKNDTTIVAR
jgi:hypothetical protein